MNDDFLTNFRKPPPREFAAALYERINAPVNTRRTFALRKVTFAAALCVALLAAVVFSPAARAAVATLVRQIGGITYVGPEETTSRPTSGSGEEYIVPEETLSLAEAQAKVPFEFHLPEWTPEGYTMVSTVRVAYFPYIPTNTTTPLVYMTWLKPESAGGDLPIELVVGPALQWLVDLDYLQEVQINGQPAGLTTGGWDADSGEWETAHHDLTLMWTLGDIMYQLHSPGATVEELIRMAESIR
jgi:hypothetical protein